MEENMKQLTVFQLDKNQQRNLKKFNQNLQEENLLILLYTSWFSFLICTIPFHPARKVLTIFYSRIKQHLQTLQESVVSKNSFR